jgi:glycosyltransferase involved in cell wall biosynthesis
MRARVYSAIGDLFVGLTQRIPSPYALDASGAVDAHTVLTRLRRRTLFFDGVLKGDYSLAIVNRYFARCLLEAGVELVLHSPEDDWQNDPMLNQMPEVRARCIGAYPAFGSFDIHLRNTWPPKADDMVGGLLNAYVCWAWEESEVPKSIVAHFNTHLDLIMVTSNFVEESLRRSGLKVPITVVGNGTDHILDFSSGNSPTPEAHADRARILHVSSCFPRKGADLLVEAFAQTFQASEPVELVIKTFENPHNSIELDVTRIRQEHPHAAPISVIKRSLAYPELVELVRNSDLLAAPSRGEGFGLPLAEALLLGVPVVTTGYSGQNDFCTDQTAWLVEYHLTASQGHLSDGNTTWAAPDITSLGRQMRRALNERTASRARVQRAQELLKAHFKWSDVIRRTAQSLEACISNSLSTTEATKLPTIDLVSTWSQVCGIATYSEHLFATSTLQPTLTRVLARELQSEEVETPSKKGGRAQVDVCRPWGYDRAGIDRLAANLATGRSDILWFQHHPGLFSAQDMDAITSSLRQSAYKVKAVTLHNVRQTLHGGGVQWLSAFDSIFVHTPSDADQILNHSCIEAHVIPHGILEQKDIKTSASAQFTVGTFGFLYPHKNVPLLVEAFARALSVAPDLRLKILTCARKDPQSWIERARIETLIEQFGIEDAVERDYRFLPDEEIISRLAECDLLCFPYGESDESATGAVRIALAADCPVLCSPSSVMKDVLPLALILAQINSVSLAEALVVLAIHPEIRGMRDARRRQFVARHSYPIIAERHLKILQKQLKDRFNG